MSDQSTPSSGKSRAPGGPAQPGRTDHWQPQDPHFAPLLEALRWRLGTARSQVQTDFAPDSVAYADVEHTTIQVFLGAAPHTDPYFDRWFVMMPLQAAPGAVLHTSRHTKVPKKAPLVSEEDVPMRVGEILVFDAHRIHWVEPSVDVGLPSPSWHEDSSQWWEKHFDQATVLIGTELRARPTREVAERRLLEFFSQYTPQCWQRATGLGGAPRPGHGPPRMRIKV